MSSKPCKEKFTPGPWRWEFNEKHKQVVLCGGKRKYDLDVMRFERYGMHGAQPTFIDPDNNMLQGFKAVSCSVVCEGREHHADWFKLIDHPDANLIAAAPEMYELLEDCMCKINDYSDDESRELIKEILSLRRKARGGNNE